VTKEKQARPRDKEVRESEQGKDGQEKKSAHKLEMKRQGKVSEGRTGNRGKTRTS
jgi:hypothetical protein